EESIRVLLGDAVDESRAKLGDLAADPRLHLVDEPRAGFCRFEPNRSSALGEAGNAPFALTADLVAVRSIDVGQADLAFESRIHRADLHPGHGPERVLSIPLER